MINYNYISDDIDKILDKKNRLAALLKIWVNNHTDYKYTTDVTKVDSKYTTSISLIR